MPNEDEPIPRLSPTLRPVPISGAAVLTKSAFRGADLNALLASYQERLVGSPDDAGVVLDISTLFQLSFNRETALDLQRRAVSQQRLFRVVGAGGSGELRNGRRRSPLRVLALVGPGDLMVNTPLEFILEGSGVVLDLLYVLPDSPLPAEVPDHDVAFVAVSEPVENGALLRRLRGIVSRWPRPVINDPQRILALSRENVFTALNNLSGVIVPLTLRVERPALERLRDGSVLAAPDGRPLDYPIVVRPVGSHAGSELSKIDDRSALRRYLEEGSSGEFYVMPFVDYRGAGDLYRKYRIVFIESRPFLCHMAISKHWMIHYLNAGMTESAEKRREEAEAMATFDEGFARRHAEAFRALDERLGLDYFGIDCSETSDGKLLVFEADVAMVIHDMDPPDLFPYKGPQMKKVFRAFEQMLEAAAHRIPEKGVQ